MDCQGPAGPGTRNYDFTRFRFGRFGGNQEKEEKLATKGVMTISDCRWRLVDTSIGIATPCFVDNCDFLSVLKCLKTEDLESKHTKPINSYQKISSK